MTKYTKDEREFLDKAMLVAMEAAIPFAIRGDVDDYGPANLASDAANHARALLNERRKLLGQDEFEPVTKPRDGGAAKAIASIRATMQPGMRCEPTDMFRSIVDVLEMLAGTESQGVKDERVAPQEASTTPTVTFPDDLVEVYWQGQKNAGFSDCDVLSGAGLGAITGLIRSSLAPILAAKDARIAELEARSPANECTNAERAQHEATIEQQRKRIEELAERENRYITIINNQLLQVTDATTNAELLRRENGQQRERIAAGTAEALRRVRERIGQIDTAEHARAVAEGVLGCVRKIINNEIAKVGGQTNACVCGLITDPGQWSAGAMVVQCKKCGQRGVFPGNPGPDGCHACMAIEAREQGPNGLEHTCGKAPSAPVLRSAAAGDCCMSCYNSHGDCVDHGNCECHTGRKA
jgi:hypothetical protein